MKTEINLENKARFFAQYWGQKVRFWTFNGPESLSKIGHTYMSKQILKGCSLCLKPLSSITEKHLYEDLKFDGEKTIWESGYSDEGDMIFIEINSIRGAIRIYFNGGIYADCEFGKFIQITIDYLRSKGYALPWMGLSVEEMAEAGWIKLQP